MFVLFYPNRDGNAKRYNVKNYYLPKGVIDNYNIVISGKNFYVLPIDFDIKRYEEIRKLTTEQGEDCTNKFLLDYEYVKKSLQINNS